MKAASRNPGGVLSGEAFQRRMTGVHARAERTRPELAECDFSGAVPADVATERSTAPTAKAAGPTLRVLVKRWLS